MRQILLVIFLPLMATNLFAQDVWDLKRCISFSIENNIGLQQMGLQEEFESEGLSQSIRDLLPTISSSSRAGLSLGRSIDPNTNSIVNHSFFNNSYELNASITLFSGFRMQNRIGYQKFRKEAGKQKRLNATDDLAFSVMDAYFDVLFCQGMLKIAENQVETSAINLKKMEKQLELGMKSKPDLYEMQANYEAEVLRRVQMGNSLKKAMLRLKQSMNLTDTVALNISDNPTIDNSFQLPETGSLFESFLKWSPYFQSAEAQLNANRKLLSISKSYLFPSIVAFGSVGTGYYETTKNKDGKTIGFSTQLDNNLGQYVGGSISIPIFGRWSTHSDIKKSRIDFEIAQRTVEQEKQKLYFEMANNLNELEATQKESDQCLKQRDADQLAFRAAERKLEQGMINMVDYYIAKNRLANSESQLLKARLQWEIKQKTLDFYMGKRFWQE